MKFFVDNFDSEIFGKTVVKVFLEGEINKKGFTFLDLDSFLIDKKPYIIVCKTEPFQKNIYYLE